MQKKTPLKTQTIESIKIPIGESVLCPISLLELDLENPRLENGNDLLANSENEVIESLVEIAALDELVTSICTNKYLNLEPLIIIGKDDNGPFTVLEGNRRLAAIKLISNPKLAKELGINIPSDISPSVFDSFAKVLVNRVAAKEDAREFIGFKHINGAQRWDAYAKAKYVTNWYKTSKESISIDGIAAKMGDNNKTMRAYIYAILILEQATSAGLWSLDDRPKARGRFGFSHFYTALGREEFQNFLGLDGSWSNTPTLHPIKKSKLENLGEVLGYLYGSISDDRVSLIKSQNPDLKDIGLAIANPEARLIIKNRGSLDDARDALKNPSDAFHDALVAANLRLKKAVSYLGKYTGKNSQIEELIDEIYENADTLKIMIQRKATRNNNRGD